MPVGKKFVVVLSVLLTGVSTALFFRKDASQTDTWQEASPENRFHDRVARRVMTEPTDFASSRSKATSRSRQALRVPTASTSAGVESGGLTPEVQPTFHKSSNPVGALLEPIENIPPDADEAAAADPGNENAVQDSSPREPMFKHRIVDGDTLSKLASQYLGRADRYLEIYELNRDVLSTPDLLPIGAELKIPPRQVAAPASSGGLQLEPLLQMVPVERGDQHASR